MVKDRAIIQDLQRVPGKWSTEETVAAFKTFIEASEDPRSGNGKSKDILVAQALGYYVKTMEQMRRGNPQMRYPDHTVDAVSQR